MAYVYGDPKTYPSASRQELIEGADKGLVGQGTVVEAMFRLKESIEAEERAIKRLTKWLLIFTMAIFILTVVLVCLGLVH